jgi:tRNA(Ile)-lysidine synthetase-like protein
VVLRQADLLSLSAAPGVGDHPASSPSGAPPPPEISWSWGRRRSCVLPARGGRLTLQADERGPLDLEALPATLTVRARRGGERLRPVRGGPHRALKSLMQEARVPAAERGRRPLIYAGDTLVAVAGLWLDESVQASEASRRRARLIWSAAG